MSNPGVGRSLPRAAWRLSIEFGALASLLFVSRFVARGHLVPQSDQECHIGAIAADVLEHGIRFPLLVYAPNEYDNGSFFSGLLAAAAFALLGRNLLALKLVTHLISAAGAVATLCLLRGCLAEIGWTGRRARQVALGVVVVEIALAPRLVTLSSLNAVGNHAEGSAINTILLALFAWRAHRASAVATLCFWGLVGLALYINKGTVLVIPVLGLLEVILARGEIRRVAAALLGFAFGAAPEIAVLFGRRGMGWMTMASKAERGLQGFPGAFFDSLLFLGEYRVGMLAVWALAVVAGVVLLIRSATRLRGCRRVPVSLALTVAVTALHLPALAVMSKGALEPYAIYGYPTLIVQVALLCGGVCESIRLWRGERAAGVAGLALVGLMVVIHRPDAVALDIRRVRSLWHNRAGAACYWRFAEGFEREHDHGLAPPGRTREQHAIERCRSFSAPEASLDCIGGIARELNWRQRGRIDGEPPAELTAIERRAYAYHYGTHRKGHTRPCEEFTSADLEADCRAAAQLECLVFADIYTRLVSGRGLGRPRCAIPEPPMEGYWAEARRDLLSRTGLGKPDYTPIPSDFDLRSCKRVLDACY